MIIKAVLNGMFDSNCYILGDEGEAAVIDPGADAEDIVKALEERDLKLKYIIMTHAHIDHISDVDKLKDSIGGETVVHEEDAPLLGDKRLNGSALFGTGRSFNTADILVKDGDVLEIGKATLRIIHTPGHTPGCICILATDSANESCLFTGDTLFRQSIGRTDLGAGDHRKIIESLRRLMEMDSSLKVYPGHGPDTTIGYENMYNPWLKPLY
jgi:hydroxyacylglutathione hydrolase